MTTSNQELQSWVKQVADHCKPDKIYWCDGSDSENDKIIEELLRTGGFEKLNESSHPGCYLHRSDPNDVARTEHLTFVCSKNKEDAGPNNNWMSPKDAHKEIDALFEGSMKGRTMYVIPYCMGPINSPLSRCGVELTDSPYVVANMRIMTRMGKAALERIERENKFVKGQHSTGDLTIENRRIMHFPEEFSIKSIGSGYGGNALLGKKCHALRIASWQARQEGWLAEHMLILGLQSPEGETTYVAAAFPSACGKTNLAMLIPPEPYKGWKVFTIGDDIAWLHMGDDGQMYAINPEAGYFGVVPGTSMKTNPTAFAMLNKDCVFTNVGLTADNKPYWEGKETDEVPATTWKNQPYREDTKPAAHPNSRFTASAKNCPSYSAEAENPKGVPISAIIFGGRRPSLMPLVFEANSWNHGVLVGASVASETTAAQTGQVGVLRRDPMAMKPFCGYNFAHYWQHWLSFGAKGTKQPKVFHVNWFRQDENGKFLWPGFGENMRILEWVIDRCRGKVEAMRTPIGSIPREEDINIEGIDTTSEQMKELLKIEAEDWKKELAASGEYFDSYGDQLPAEIKEEHQRILGELNT